MEIEVPVPFLDYMRRQKLKWAVWRINIVLVVALILLAFFPSRNVFEGVTGGIGLSLVPMVILLLSGHSAVHYYFYSEGIGLTASRFGPGLMTVAYQYAFFWRRDPLVSMEYSHWEGLPALLLKTVKRPYGFLLPLARTDLEAVIAYLRPQVFIPPLRQL